MSDKQDDNDAPEAPSNRLEWTLGIGSFIIVFALIGTVLFSAVTETSAFPDLRVETGDPVQTGDIFVVPVTVHNEGDVTAADVQVSAELSQSGDIVDEAEMQLRYVPAHSQSDGGLVFRINPSTGDLTVDIRGYRKP
jgi:uncharacterized protein (TIGR02588 family)